MECPLARWLDDLRHQLGAENLDPGQGTRSALRAALASGKE
jgi:hypothetical protein